LTDFTIKQHDTHPSLEATLTDQDGAINLTTATTVKLLLKTPTGGTAISGTCAIVSAVAGTVRYDWTAPNTADVNTFDGEFEITWSNGKITTVPNDSYFSVEIKADLG
jgi:hypothetical protein